MRKVARILFQRIVSVFRGARVGGTPLAQSLDCGIQVLRGDTRTREDFASFALLIQREREQQTLDCDIAVAGLFGDLLRLIEDARQRRGQIDLACAAA